MAKTDQIRRGGGRRSWLLRLLTLVVSFAFACVLSEAMLRVAGCGRSYFNPFRAFHESDDLIGIRGRPNFVGHLKNSEIDVVIENDEIGFRKAARPVAAAPERKNVFILGDSFVWGWGVGQGRVVSDRLQERLPDCRVKNFGVSATGTVQQFAIFQKFVLPELRRGDAVVIAFFANDFGDNLGVDHAGRLYARVEKGQIRLVRPDGSACPHGLLSRLSDASYLVNLVTYCSNRLIHSWQRESEMSPSPAVGMSDHGPATDNPPGPSRDRNVVLCNSPARLSVPYLADDSAEVQVARHYLEAFAAECRRRGAEMLVVYVPWQTEIGERPKESRAVPARFLEGSERRALLRCTRALAIPTIDLVPVFLSAKTDGKTGPMTIGKDFHWSETGHFVAARAIANFLATRETSERRRGFALAPGRPAGMAAD